MRSRLAALVPVLVAVLAAAGSAGGAAPKPADPGRDKAVVKYSKIDTFEAQGSSRLRAQIGRALRGAKVDERTAVAAIHELMRLGLRVGSLKYATQPGGGAGPRPSYGASTLWAFVEPLGPGKGVRLDFPGKDQVRWTLTLLPGGEVEMAFRRPEPKAKPGVKRKKRKRGRTSKRKEQWAVNLKRAVHPKLAEVVATLALEAQKSDGRLQVPGADGASVVIHEGRIQQRLRQHSGVERIWNHGLRHLRARQLLRAELRRRMKQGVPRSARKAQKELTGAIKQVARHLGHTTWTTTRDAYTDPRTYDAYLRWARIRARRDHGIDAEQFGRIERWQSKGWRSARAKLDKALREAKEQGAPTSATRARKILKAAKKDLPKIYTFPRIERDYLVWARDQAKLQHGVRKFGRISVGSRGRQRR